MDYMESLMHLIIHLIINLVIDLAVGQLGRGGGHARWKRRSADDVRDVRHRAGAGATSRTSPALPCRFRNSFRSSSMAPKTPMSSGMASRSLNDSPLHPWRCSFFSALATRLGYGSSPARNRPKSQPHFQH